MLHCGTTASPAIRSCGTVLEQAQITRFQWFIRLTRNGGADWTLGLLAALALINVLLVGLLWRLSRSV
jgi:hypothetical protein